jgi:hypothetical protein
VQPTYGERLGFPADARVAIFHIDDAGMCPDSNAGTIEGLENGITMSASIMFPCPSAPEMAAYAVAHPTADIGVHCTLTAEWGSYRWPPVAGNAVPGLIDEEGFLWHSVPEVVFNASPDEFETEIRAQLERCRSLGLEPTHLDTHMGTVFSPTYVQRYVEVGIDSGVPVLIFGGHLQHVGKNIGPFRWYLKGLAKKAWDAGLPVIDDLVTSPTEGATLDAKKAHLKDLLRAQQPGITQYIVHCTKTSPDFSKISGSGATRLAELQMVTDPEIKQFVKDEGIILTTWRELLDRRKAAQAREEEKAAAPVK